VHKPFIITLLMWTGLSQSVLACDFLPITSIQQTIEISGSLEHKVLGPKRCSYSWKKQDIQTIERENQERIRNAMRRGQENNQERVSGWANVSAEILFIAQTEASAKQHFSNYLNHNFSKSYGSPSPLQNAQWEIVGVSGGQAAWSKASQQLLIQKSNSIAILNVKVEDNSDKNKALALKIAAGFKL